MKENEKGRSSNRSTPFLDTWKLYTNLAWDPIRDMYYIRCSACEVRCQEILPPRRHWWLMLPAARSRGSWLLGGRNEEAHLFVEVVSPVAAFLKPHFLPKTFGGIFDLVGAHVEMLLGAVRFDKIDDLAS